MALVHSEPTAVPKLIIAKHSASTAVTLHLSLKTCSIVATNTEILIISQNTTMTLRDHPSPSVTIRDLVGLTDIIDLHGFIFARLRQLATAASGAMVQVSRVSAPVHFQLWLRPFANRQRHPVVCRSISMMQSPKIR